MHVLYDDWGLRELGREQSHKNNTTLSQGQRRSLFAVSNAPRGRNDLMPLRISTKEI